MRSTEKRNLELSNELNQNSQPTLLLEYFIVSAISALLIIRLFLTLTGFPQVGGHGLHIAHMLWGGMLMLIAIILALIYTDTKIKKYIAIIGGIGFGAFIDEIGKFITSNNDYFFSPAIAIIYIIFVLIYLFTRFYSGAFKTSDFQDKTTEYIEAGSYYRFKKKFNNKLFYLFSNRFLTKILIGYFILQSLASLLLISLVLPKLYYIHLDLISYIQVITVIVLGISTLLSLFYYLRGKKINTYKVLLFNSLVSLLVLQFFQFWEDQFFALIGFIINISIYITLRRLLERKLSTVD